MSGVTSPSPTAVDRSADGVSLVELTNLLLRRWRILVGIPVALLLVMLTISFIVAPTFTASTSLVPEGAASSSSIGQLAGLAGQFGISLGSNGSESPRFYADVVKSREILVDVLGRRYPTSPTHRATLGDSILLIDALQAEGKTPAKRLDDGIRILRDRITVGTDDQTGIVSISVDARDPMVATAVANQLVRDLNTFNLERRQSSARARRQFIEGRLANARQDLRGAEDSITDWLRRNRQYQSSPELQAEYQRLQRQVDIRQEVYLTLSRQYETARIEEVNSTPVITVIDSAAVPQRKSKPNRRLWAAGSVLAGGFVAIILAFALEFLDRAEQNSSGDLGELDRMLKRFRRQPRPPRRSRGRSTTVPFGGSDSES